MRLLGPSLIALKGEKLSHLNVEHLGESFQFRDGRRIHATLHKADKFNRAAYSFGESLLGELLRPSQSGNPLTKFSLEHGV